MDGFNPRGTTVAEYMDGTPSFRTDLYASRGTLMTHAESIQLFKKLGVKMTPELKFPTVQMPFDGFTQEQYAQKMIDWRLGYADRTLTGYRATPRGLEVRAA